MLLSLVVLAAAVALVWWLLRRRRMRYAVRYTNIGVLASVTGGTSWRVFVPPILFVAALAALCVSFARPHVNRMVAKERAVVDPRDRHLPVDAGRRRQADAARRGAGGGAEVRRPRAEAAPDRPDRLRRRGAGRGAADGRPRARQAVDRRDRRVPGLRRDGDRRCTGVRGRPRAAVARRTDRRRSHSRAAPADDTKGLASILFLSDGAQTRGTLLPEEGARAGEGGRDPGLHRRTRHARGRHSRLRPRAAAEAAALPRRARRSGSAATRSSPCRPTRSP